MKCHHLLGLGEETKDRTLPVTRMRKADDQGIQLHVGYDPAELRFPAVITFGIDTDDIQMISKERMT